MSCEAITNSKAHDCPAEALGRSDAAQNLIEEHVRYLWRELDGDVQLSDAAARELRTYYPWVVPGSGHRGAVVRETMVSRLQYALEWLMRRGPGARVLDAGCGLGTESLLFGQIGAEVVGVDLYEKYVTAAQERLEQFEAHIGKRLNVRLSAMNLFDISPDDPFDLIYCREAISHIEPVSDFLDFSYSRLAPRGQLVVSDANGTCLANQLDRLRIRGRRCLQTEVDPASGSEVQVAHERILSIPRLKRELRGAGLRPVHEERRIHLQRLADLPGLPIVRAVARALERVPGLSLLVCTHYVIGAERPSETEAVHGPDSGGKRLS